VNVLDRYIDAWRRHDVDGVLATLTDDCVIIEAPGPVYRGRDRIRQWMRAWLRVGSVDAWHVTLQVTAGDILVAEWQFSCTWQGDPASFDGVTVARTRGDRIRHLREYATTAPLYEWTGFWRE
jgi:ketosteroid isomerase-like protein